MYFGIGNPQVYHETRPEAKKPHLYDNPERGIKKIRVFGFYFVPQNKSNLVLTEWRSIFEKNLEKLKNFHSFELQGLSEIEYKIYPEAVIGLEKNDFYDTEDTGRGNPHALLKISEELEKRIFTKSGDLYREDFDPASNEAYPVMLIFYEGVGATGGIIRRDNQESKVGVAEKYGVPESLLFEVDVELVDGFVLLSSSFFTKEEFKNYGASILAHEFYHTLGFRDAYEVPGSFEVVFSNDLMGAGRKRPIERTYLNRDNLHKLGL